MEASAEVVGVQVGAERYNLFTGCTKTRSVTLVLRGGAEQFIDEAERSLHDAIMIVRRALKNATVVAGGGAVDMELSRWALPPFRSRLWLSERPPFIAISPNSAQYFSFWR